MKQTKQILYSLLMAIVMIAMSPMRAWAQEADSRLAVFSKLEGVTATFEDEGDYPWGLTRYIGLDALMSTNQDKDGTTSTTTIKLACDQAIELQFRYKTSSEASDEYLIISVDGNEVVNSQYAEPDEDGIATVVGTYSSLLHANANGHTITMSYIKNDNSSSRGDDYGFIYLIQAYTHQHYYNATSCDWSEDNTSATLHLECECGETADVEATTITRTEEAPTCVKDGFCTITASAAYNGKTVTDSKTETFAALGHDWQVQSDGTYACQREGCTAQSATFPIEVIESSGGFEGEGPENLFDGAPNTKWCGSNVENGSNSFYVIFKTGKPSVLVSYSLVDAEDTQEYNNRGWSSWDIQGTNDPNLALWKSISSKNGDYQGSTFTTGNTTAYTYYKITFCVVDNEEVDENEAYYLQQMADMNITWCTEHQWGEDHKCSVCGYECQHSWEYGECTICGYECKHKVEDDDMWENGECTICGYECQHPEYSSINDESHLCTVCQQYGEKHKWGADECCTVCGVASTGETYCATVTIGENTKNFIHVESAVAAAMEADEATVVLLSNCNFGGTGISLTKGNITLDLNSKTLSAYGSFVIHVNGCSLTITDNSEDKTGAVRGVGGGVTVVSGSITIHEGTLYASQSSCLNIDANVTAQIDGGRFYTGHEYSNAIYTNGVAALAPDYAYYITDTETQVVVDENGNIPAKDVTVKKAEEGSESTESNYVATVTIGETTTGYAFFQDAVAAAKDASSATICLCKDVSTSYIFFDKGNVTLDLNGKTLSNPNGSTIEVQGGSLTIIDSSEEKTGMVQNGGTYQSSTITASSGSLTIYAGTFNSPSMSALSASPAYGSAAMPTVTVYGGHFISRSYAAILAESPIALGPGYAYYNTETENETILNNIAYGFICDANGNLVHDITVKESPATMTLQVKDASGEDVVLTKGEDGTYSTSQTIKLTDAGFASLYEFTASSVNYNRDLTALTGSDWGTLCLPFDIPYNAAAGVTFYTLASATNESVTLTAITSGNIEAGTPLLFKRGSETDKLGLNFTTPTMLKTSIASGSSADGLTLKGTFTSKTVYSGYYLDANSGKLHSIQAWYDEKGDGLTIPAFRAWLDGNVSSEAKALNIIIDDEEVTAIDALNAFIQGKADIYGLDGQKRSDLQKGINIVNGKKILVK